MYCNLNNVGEFTMEKVKVQRYVTGKRPDFAPEVSSDEEDDVEFTLGRKTMSVGLPTLKTDAEKEDKRLRRLHARHQDDDDEEDMEDR